MWLLICGCNNNEEPSNKNDEKIEITPPIKGNGNGLKIGNGEIDINNKNIIKSDYEELKNDIESLEIKMKNYDKLNSSERKKIETKFIEINKGIIIKDIVNYAKGFDSSIREFIKFLDKKTFSEILKLEDDLKRHMYNHTYMYNIKLREKLKKDKDFFRLMALNDELGKQIPITSNIREKLQADIKEELQKADYGKGLQEKIKSGENKYEVFKKQFKEIEREEIDNLMQRTCEFMQIYHKIYGGLCDKNNSLDSNDFVPKEKATEIEKRFEKNNLILVKALDTNLLLRYQELFENIRIDETKRGNWLAVKNFVNENKAYLKKKIDEKKINELLNDLDFIIENSHKKIIMD